MQDLLALSAVEARAALDAKDVSSVELTSAYIQAAEDTAALNNYVLLAADKALDMASDADKRIADGESSVLGECRCCQRPPRTAARPPTDAEATARVHRTRYARR